MVRTSLHAPHCKIWGRRHFTALLVLLLPLFLTSCTSTYEKIVTYHVEFTADGNDYSATTQYPWYYVQTFATRFEWADYNKARIYGVLRDGSEYEVVGTTYSYWESGHGDIQPTVFVRITPNVVESFDAHHDHSPNHIIHIIKSYVDIRNEGNASYDVAKDVHEKYIASEKYIHVYHTVGVKVTPFDSVKEAKDDFYNSGPSQSPPLPWYKKAKFSFHPEGAEIDNSDVDITYKDHIFHATLPASDLAHTWVLDPHVTVKGSYTSGDSPNTVVEFNHEKIVIPPTILRTVHLDPTTHKASIFYEDDTWLRFITETMP